MCTKDFKSTKAITLIALVVSIVVLLILAGVSIVTLTGDNGLLNRTTSAKQKTELATFKEKLNLAYMSAYTDNAQNGTYTVSMTDLIRELNNDYPEYNQAGKIESRESGSVLSIVAKLGDVELNDTTSPLILGTGETKTIVIEQTTTQGAGETKFVNLDGKYYQIILDGNGVTLGEAQENLPESENELAILKGEGLSNVTATETSDLNVEVEAGSTLDEGNITFTYGGKTTIVKVQVKNVYTVEVVSEDTNKGTVSVSPSSTDNKYEEGNILGLTATVNSGYYFDGWYSETTKLSESSSYSYSVGTSNVTIKARFLKYGKTVELGQVKAKNGVAMTSGWRYFLEDTNNIYLMYGDYLENAQIPTGTNITVNGCIISTSGNKNNRNNLVNYLNGATGAYSSTWDTINNGVKVAVKARLIANGVTEAKANTAIENITTKGAPTPEQWMNSYNENYGTKLGAQNFTDLSSTKTQTYYKSDSSTGNLTEETGTVSIPGYLYTRDNTMNTIKWETYVPSNYMMTTGGYPGYENSNMYYPHANSNRNSWESCNGYWLAGIFASTNYDFYVCSVSCQRWCWIRYCDVCG